MDYFFVFQFALKQGKLDYLEYVQINPNAIVPQSQIVVFQNISLDFTNSATIFKKMLTSILKKIYELAINFTNVVLVCQDISLFTKVLPNQCTRKNISLPYVFTNFIDIIQFVRYEFKCPYKDLHKMSQFLCIGQDKKQKIIEKILLKLIRQQKIVDTDVRLIKQKNQKIIEKGEKPSQSVVFKYFKCIGLPFRIFESQVFGHLASQLPQSHKQIYFIYEKQRFSGKALIKIPQFYEKQLLAKNRMYIGNRYIQIQKSTEQAFQQLKITSIIQKRNKKNSQFQRKTNFDNSNKFQKQQKIQDHSFQTLRMRNFENKSIQQKRSRSRSFQKQKRRINVLQNNLTQNSQEGIRIKGLPFSFTQWDVQNLFSFYNIIPGSVKLGHKPGTAIKNGDAVVLFRNHSDASRGLQMDGFTLMNRYLQINLIKKHQYDRYS